MRGLLYLGAAAAIATALVGVIARRAPRERELGPLLLPCEQCEAPTWIRVAHTHHHEPGCGIDDPAVESCRCDFYLCAACCPCKVEAQLQERAS